MRKPEFSRNFLGNFGIATTATLAGIGGVINYLKENNNELVHTTIANQMGTTQNNFLRIFPSQEKYYDEVEMRAEYVRSIQRIVDQFGGEMQYTEHEATNSMATLINIDVDQASARTIFEILRTPGSSRVRITFNGIDSSYGIEMPSPDHRTPVEVTEANTGAQVYFNLHTGEVGPLAQVLQSVTEDVALPLDTFGMSHQSDDPMSDSAANALMQVLPLMNIKTEIAIHDIGPDNRGHPDSPLAACTAEDFTDVTSRYCAVNGNLLVTSQLAGVSNTCIPSKFLKERMEKEAEKVAQDPLSDSLTLTTPPPPPSRE